MQLFDTGAYAVEKGEMKESFKTKPKIAEAIREASRRVDWPDHYAVANTEKQIREISRLIKQDGEFIFDVETTGTNPWKHKVLGIGVNVPSGKSFCIPLEHRLMTCAPVSMIQEHLGKFFSDPGIRRTNHNIKFDGHFIREQLKIPVGSFYCDTLLQSKVINPDNAVPHGLKELCSYYGISDDGGNYTKQFGRTAWSYIDARVASFYLCKDVELVRKLKGKQDQVLSVKDKLRSLFWDVEMPVLNLSFLTETRGIRVDQKYIDETMVPTIYTQYRAAVEAIRPYIEPYMSSVEAKTVEDVLESPKQLGIIFFDCIGIPLIKFVTLKRNKDSGEFTDRTLDKDAISELQADHIEMKLLGDFRKVNTVRKMFVDALPPMIVRGRIHPTTNEIGAATGRESMKAPNLTQVPSRMGPLIRNMFIPDEGNVFLSMDFSQQEMRIMAHFTKDAALRKIFIEDKTDLYSQTAIDMFKQDTLADFDTDEKKKANPRRALAKSITLGLGYGMQPKKFARNAGMALAEAKKLFDLYHATYPGVRTYQERAAEFARKNGHIVTLLGRERPLPNINNREMRGWMMKAERAAGNTPIQGSGADWGKLAKVKVAALIAKHRWPVQILIMVHDEILYEADGLWVSKNMDKVHEIRRTMETAMTISVPMKCSVQIESRWGSSVKVDDLDDMFDYDEDEAA